MTRMGQGKPVVMAVDRSMASDYRGTAYFGFSACLPRRLLPEALYYRLMAPPALARPDGSIGLADCGSRKVEAALRRAGFGPEEFLFAHPSRLIEAVGPATKVFLFGSHDPLGIGPVTSMLTGLMGRGAESYNAAAVARMLADPALRAHRPRIIAGGAGAWQLAVDERARKALCVDCVVLGEGEGIVPGLVRRALEGEELPEVVEGPTVSAEEIPGITGPTVNGVIEVARGCGRGCSFCVPNLQRLRSMPLERICEEAALTAPHNRGRVVLHAEDIFRYQALPRFRVNHDALCSLFESVSRQPGVTSVGASHGTLTGALSSPETVAEISRLLRVGRPGGARAFGIQMGIETGSRRLAREHLAAKMRPFDPDAWPDIVLEGAELCRRHGVFSCFTLVFGLPGETPSDVGETLALVRHLTDLPSLLVPLFYVPMGVAGRTRRGRPFTFEAMSPAHFDLLQACWEHNYRHLGTVWQMYAHPERPLLERAVHALVRGGTGYLRRRTERFVRRHRGPGPATETSFERPGRSPASSTCPGAPAGR